MKALTIHQPWAWLITNGYKSVENRSRRTTYRGPLAIHAGARRGAERQGWLSEELLAKLRAAGYPIPDVDELVFSAVVGRVDLVDCVEYDPDSPRLPGLDQHGLEDDPFASGPWCWILANPRALAEPIAQSGARGLWEWDGEIA